MQAKCWGQLQWTQLGNGDLSSALVCVNDIIAHIYYVTFYRALIPHGVGFQLKTGRLVFRCTVFSYNNSYEIGNKV